MVAAAKEPAYPLTGLPLKGLPPEQVALAARPALVVKIDNAPKARPQAGINQADVVVEEQVEGGITRLATIFHSQDADAVGPVRSARSTDLAIMAPLQRPLFAYSGANAAFEGLVRAAPVTNVGHSALPGAYRRQRGRPAPYNLFSSTLSLRAGFTGTPPIPLFNYRPMGAAARGKGVADARGVHIEYRVIVTTIAEYAWNGQVWQRTQNGTPHLDAAGVQVAPANVVVQFVPYRDTGLRDQSGAAVPEAELVGEGEVWVLTGGKVLKGRWSKASPEAVTTYVDGAGSPVLLAPGQTWVELVPPGQAQLS